MSAVDVTLQISTIEVQLPNSVVTILVPDPTTSIIEVAQQGLPGTPAIKKVGTLGNGAATSFAIVHNWNTLDIVGRVYRTAVPHDVVGCDVELTDVNTITFKFTVAPSTAQYTYVILA